jgi:hypothetical protein
MTVIRSGTIQDLRLIRDRHDQMRQAEGDLARLGYTRLAIQLGNDADELGRLQFAVCVPCVVCGGQFPVAVQVDDPKRPEPNMCLCESCDARVNAEVAQDRAGEQEKQP